MMYVESMYILFTVPNLKCVKFLPKNGREKKYIFKVGHV